MAESKIENAPWVRLGDYIDNVSIKNKNNITFVSGVNIFKEFMPTVADLNGTDISKYQVVPSRHFACNLMHIGRDIKLPIAFNYSANPIVVSPAYEVFKVKDEKASEILPAYLITIFKVNEIDRLCWFYTDSSIRGNLTWDRFCEIKIPLPSIETQRELVAVYNGLKELAEENEKLLEPLSKSCEAFIVDCKKKYPAVMLKNKIEECKKRNSDLLYGVEYLQGVTSEGKFDESKANTEGLDFSNYKIVYKNNFAYNPSRINVGSIALSLKENAIVSPMYIVFKITDNNLIPEYLKLWFSRKEFQRSTYFYAMGSVRDTFDFNLMQEVQIPLPPKEVQQKIVDLYNCYEECKRIAKEARGKISNLCPALVQKAANSR